MKRFAKLFVLILTLSVCVIGFSGCGKNNGPNPDIRMVTVTSPKEFLFAIGETVQVEAHVAVENGAPQTVVWSSSNPQVATVSTTGLVTALNDGWADIIAKSTESFASHSVRIAVASSSNFIGAYDSIVGSSENHIIRFFSDGTVNWTNQMFTDYSSNTYIGTYTATGGFGALSSTGGNISSDKYVASISLYIAPLEIEIDFTEDYKTAMLKYSGKEFILTQR